MPLSLTIIPGLPRADQEAIELTNPLSLSFRLASGPRFSHFRKVDAAI